MKFISHGDYLLPLQFPMYWAQHVFTWSYERGAANPDGILRLPGRLVDIAVFALAGNLAFGYFYVTSCLVIAFLSFFWFALRFLQVERVGVAFIGALFFACNPIFLGNISKVGLLLAVAMLPFILTALKQGFVQKRLSYFLLAILGLNISLIHPFTFTVNLFVCLCYIAYAVRGRLPFIRDNAWKMGALLLLSVLLNAYFILPLVNLGTVDKGALSDTVSSAPTDYTSLVDIANTGDIFTGLSLSKGVLKDYEFYGPMTWPFYFLGVFMFYALLFGAYIAVEKRAKPRERRRFVIALGLFLLLVVLATANYIHADVLIKFLIGLPGGWMFRSPLKWQLYIPIALFTALVIALKYIHAGWRRRLLYGAFGISFVFMNGYVAVQVFEHLLTPRQISHFATLYDMPMEHKNMLFVDSSSCIGLARNSPEVVTELNQVLTSKPVQVKHVQAGNLDSVNVGAYDFLMGCRGAITEQMPATYHLAPIASFVDGAYELYGNTRPRAYASSSSQLFELEEDGKVAGKYSLATNELKQSFSFITKPEQSLPTTRLEDVFETFSPEHITNGTVQGSIPADSHGRQLFVLPGKPLYYTLDSNELSLAAIPQAGFQQLPVGSLPLPGTEKLRVSYQDPGFAYKNMIINPSLEQGLWQKKVGDCNAYDDKPSLTMRRTSLTKTDGDQSLELTARAHIACTGPAEVTVVAGQHYLLSFDYQTDGGRYSGYYASFDNLDITATGARLEDTKGAWQSFTAELVAPPGAERLRLLLYAYPSHTLGQVGQARYDNISLIPVPAITSRFFVVSGKTPSSDNLTIAETPLNPTKTLLYISAAKAPFYLITKESYHHLWRLTPNENQGGLLALFHTSPSIPAIHLRVNGSMNGWYIDPDEACKHIACVRNDDGTYSMSLAMEFAPQRWFYRGVLISSIALTTTAAYVAYDMWQHRRNGDKRS